MNTQINSAEVVRLYTALTQANNAGTDNLTERIQLTEEINSALKDSGVERFDLILMCEVEPNEANLLEMERRSRVTISLANIGIEVREKKLVQKEEVKNKLFI